MPVTKSVVILDGGSGMTLVEMGHKQMNDDPLWSAAIVHSHPNDLIKLHKQFFLSGADVVVTTSYQASVAGYMKHFGVGEKEAQELIKKGVYLTKTARDEAAKETGRQLYVAASVGPYGATLADLSEYHGRYVDTMSREDLKQWHVSRLRTLLEAGPDLLAIETIPALAEAEAILDGLSSLSQTKAWVTFQCKDATNTAHGESIADAVRAMSAYENVVAVGVNCVHPRNVTSLLDEIQKASPSVPVIVKPNGGLFLQDGGSSERFKISQMAEEWLNHGATWIGGCCHVFASDIEELRKTFSSNPNVHLLQKDEKLF